MGSGMTANLFTTDPDAARVELTDIYCPHRLIVKPRSGQFGARHFSGGFPGLGVHLLDYGTSEVEVAPVPFEEFVLVSRPVRGTFTVTSGEDILSSARDAIVMDPLGNHRLRWQGGCKVVNLVLERHRFESVAAELTGSDQPGRVRFRLGPPTSTAAAEAWTAVTRLLLRDIVPSGVGIRSPLVRAQILRLTVAALLEAYPGTFVGAEPSTGDWVGPASVRRALDFMELAAGQDISLADIAEAGRTSVRGLQRAFRSHLGTTPLRRLREIRLYRAHDELQETAPVDRTSIAELAYRWGFSNPSRFAEEHRRVFGCLPSEVPGKR